MKSRQRILEPIERYSEILFGLIMVLTFTCSLNVAQAGRGDVRTMLLGALGCNIAWGFIDGMFYLMARLSDQGHNLILLQRLRRTADPVEARLIVASALPEVLVSVLPPTQLDVMWQKLNQLPNLPKGPHFTKDAWLGAVGVFLLVMISTFPPVIPFLFVTNIRLAVRISNAIALVMLFLTGAAYGKYSGHRKWKWAFSMVLIGSIMVALTVRLGG